MWHNQRMIVSYMGVTFLCSLGGCYTNDRDRSVGRLPNSVTPVEPSLSELSKLEDVFNFAWFIGLLNDFDRENGGLPSLNPRTGAPGFQGGWRYELLRSRVSRSLIKTARASPQYEVYDRFLKQHSAWNSPEFSETMESLRTGIPFAEDLFPLLDDTTQACTVLAVTGRGAAFDPESPISMKSLDDDTILLVEGKRSNGVWWEPQEADLLGKVESLLGDEKGISSSDNCGFLVGFKDGTIWRLAKSIPSSELRKFLDIESAKKYDREAELRQWKCRVTYPIKLDRPSEK